MSDSIIKLQNNTSLKDSKDIINRNFLTVVDTINTKLILSRTKKVNNNGSKLCIGNFYDLGSIIEFPDIEDTSTSDNQLLKEIQGIFTVSEGFSFTVPSNIKYCYVNFTDFTVGKSYSFKIFDNYIEFLQFQN